MSHSRRGATLLRGGGQEQRKGSLVKVSLWVRELQGQQFLEQGSLIIGQQLSGEVSQNMESRQAIND